MGGRRLLGTPVLKSNMAVSFTRFLPVAFVLLTPVAFAQDKDERIVFVCEHGSVKSLIAASLFDRAAEERGLPFRAVARGINPEAHVPPAIVAAMHGDGFEVEEFRPQGLQKEDVAGAARVVAIGVDLTARVDGAKTLMQSWDDVPPASVDYAAARAALQRHIDALLDDLQGKTPVP